MRIKERRVILLIALFLLLQITNDGQFSNLRGESKESIHKFEIDEVNESVVELILLPPTFEEFINTTNPFHKNLRDSMYLEAKIYVESRGYPRARDGNQIGILQITPIMIRECNNILKRIGDERRYTVDDRFNPIKSKEIYRIVMEYHNPKFVLFEASCIWNAGRKSNSLNESVYGIVRIYHNKIVKRMQFLYTELLENNKN
jgi:hypothetical protein